MFFVFVCGDWGAVFLVSGFGFAAGIYLYDLLLFVAIVVVVIVLVVVGT